MSKTKNKKNGKIIDLIKNTIIIFIGKISTQFISFLLLPLYTAFIDTNEYGYVDLVTTYISLIITVVILQLDTAAFRFLIDYRKNEEVKKKVISNIFISATILTLIFTLIYIFVAKYILKVQYMWLILLIIVSNILLSILLQIARGLGNNVDYSLSSIIGGVTTIILNIILIVHYKLGGLGLLISMLFSNLFASVYLIFRLKVLKMIRLKYRDKKTTSELIKYSAPLVPNQISLWILSISDRTIISAVLGTASNGIYSIANKFSIILNSIYNIFYLAWSEQATLYFKDDDRDNYFSVVVNNSIKIFSVLCLLIITVMPLIFGWLINVRYADAYFQIPILLLGTLFNLIVGQIGVVYVAKKRTKEIAKTSIAAAIINILLNAIFIKKFGLYAASFSTFIAYLTVMLYRWFDIKKYITIKLEKRNIFYLIPAFAIAIYCYYLNITNINIICFIASIILAIYINKDIIKMIITTFINFIKKKKANKK